MALNRVLLIGNLGGDPDLRYTNSQQPVCTLNIATTERRRSPEGEWSEHTEWHKVVVFGKTAENCSQYLSKGRQVFIEGRLQTRKWQDKQGNDRYTTEVVASNVQFLGGKGGDAAPRGEAAPAEPAFEASPANPVKFDDDDIPF